MTEYFQTGSKKPGRGMAQASLDLIAKMYDIRIALLPDQTVDLPSFPASDKRKDPRYRWFVENYGTRCWEIDAMDPRDLRDCVEQEIKGLIEPKAWARCEVVNKAERESLQTILSGWKARP